MASILDAIKKEAKKQNGYKQQNECSDGHCSTSSMIIEQKLNKLMYEPPNPDEESEFIRLVLNKNGYNKERAGLHASAIISSEKEFCYREQVLSLFFKQAQGHNIPIGLKRIFEEGNAIHEKWQRLFIRGGIATKEDLDRSRFMKKYDLSFTPDGCPVKIANHDYVAEIKSVNTFQFKSMKSHPSGKKQLMLYMHLTGIHKGFVLCEDKNTQDIKVFAYGYNHEEVLPYVERLEGIQEFKRQFIEERKPPSRHPECKLCTSKRAEKCNMKDACFNVGMGRVKL